MREPERKFDPDDTVAEVLIEFANNMPKRRVSENRNVCPPEAEQYVSLLNLLTSDLLFKTKDDCHSLMKNKEFCLGFFTL